MIPTILLANSDQIDTLGIAADQRAYVERVIGTIRRECLDHMIVFNECCLYEHLQGFINYYHRSRTHLALEKDSPEPRPLQSRDAGQMWVDSTIDTSVAPPELAQ